MHDTTMGCRICKMQLRKKGKATSKKPLCGQFARCVKPVQNIMHQSNRDTFTWKASKICETKVSFSIEPLLSPSFCCFKLRKEGCNWLIQKAMPLQVFYRINGSRIQSPGNFPLGILCRMSTTSASTTLISLKTNTFSYPPTSFSSSFLVSENQNRMVSINEKRPRTSIN